MDLSLTEEQQAIADLSGQILTDKLPPKRLREIETDPTGRWFADDVWNELAKADLLGVCLPESVGGGGYGFMEACLILEQQGRTVAPLPLMATLVLGALPIARFGTPAQQQEILPGVINGSTILTAALFEAGEYMVPSVPATTATRDGDGWRLEGEKILVPAAHLASRVLVPARTNGSVGVFLVDPSAGGVELERNEAISDEPSFLLRLTGAAGEPLGDPQQGEEIVEWLTARAITALCSIQVGVCDVAVRLTAAYVSEREQFGAKIGTFQAVAQRIADAYIDSEGIRLTALQAAWRLSQELPASDEVHIAKFWACFGGDRVVHAAQHLHGGVGVDLDYPVHRYFRWSKVIELTLGTATEHLRQLGQRIAASP
ncbi:MAG: 3-oxocholest-4-en-26-oyl-CoA dehydrogenase beta subunit [Acidimicrobiaceae bacterium]|jgi:alkylation response protein AidB-like acyl-CoA dehydrogenase